MNKKKSNIKEYMKILAPNFEDMESVLDSCGHELINEVNIAYEKLGKDRSKRIFLLWELTDKFLEFQHLLRQQLKELYPDHNFKNF
jgi:hypothetical protein